MNTLDEGVRRYIDMKRNVLRNMGAIQNELAKLQGLFPELTGFEALRKVQMILDDPFAAHGSLAGP